MSQNKPKLPGHAYQFMIAYPSKKYSPVINAFYQWISKRHLYLEQLTPTHIQDFISCPRKKKLSSYGANQHRKCLAKYLIWLHEKTPLSFDPICFRKSKKFPLCETAIEFLRTLKPVLHWRTISGYRAGLIGFHKWLDKKQLSLANLQRRHTSEWLCHIHSLGHVPSSRKAKIIYVRVYFRWLYEHGLMTAYPDDLLRSSDKPKEPKYLPRPFPPSTDKEIQTRLTQSEDLYYQGLLLMRLTGLRVGELISLENDCVRIDHLGNRFLKVPLGKLYTERLVPLDNQALGIIETIQCGAGNRSNKTFLIEDENGQKTVYKKYLVAIKEVTNGLQTNGKAVTHRLRHTYATALLDGGMSVVGIMKLLGHNNPTMTLRYAAITNENIGRQYFKAIATLKNRYSGIFTAQNLKQQHPALIIDDAVHLVQKLTTDTNGNPAKSRALTKRLNRIKADIEKLFPSKNNQ